METTGRVLAPTGSRENERRPVKENINKLLIYLLILSALVRIAWWDWRVAVIENEGAEYARIAQNLRLGNGYVGTMVGPELVDPPLFPVFIVAASYLTGNNYERAARTVTLAAGLVLVAATFLLARRLYGTQVAAIAGLLVSLSPILIAASVQACADGVYTSMVILGLYLGLRAVEQFTPIQFGVVGIVFGLAYLTRAEGFLYPFGIAAAALVISRLRRISIRRVATCCAVMFLSFAPVAAPYIYFLQRHTGHLRIEGKSEMNFQLSEKVSSGEPPEQAAWGINDKLQEEGVMLNPNAVLQSPSRQWTSRQKLKVLVRNALRNAQLIFVLRDFSRTGFPILLVLAYAGICWTPWTRTRALREIYMLLMFPLVLSSVLLGGWLQFRYIYASLVVALIWSAKGTDALAEKAAGAWSQTLLAKKVAVRWTAIATVALVLLLTGVSARKLEEFNSAHPSHIGLKQAGLWLDAYKPGPKTVMDSGTVVSFYGDGVWVPMPYADPALTLRYIEKKQPEFVVVNGLSYAWVYPAGKQWLQSGISDARAKLVYKSGHTPFDSILIYEWWNQSGVRADLQNSVRKPVPDKNW